MEQDRARRWSGLLRRQLESHRYQTLQAADWIAGLVGRLGAIWTEPDAWPENVVFRRYFESRLRRVQVRSGVRG